MAPTLTDDLHGVLQSLLGLYGDGQPDPGSSMNLVEAITHQLQAHTGAGAVGYTDARSLQTAMTESHAGRDGVVYKAVAESSDGTINGRNKLADQISEFRTRALAIASVGDTRFSGPALLDAAQTTIANATKQVDSDVVAVRQRAAQIAPATTKEVTRRKTTTTRRRRRARSRSAVLSRGGRVRVPSDGTTGSKAVGAASAWLGTPYIWGGGGAGGPSGGGFDCSGLTQYAIAQASDGHVVLPRTTYEQIYSGVRVSPHDVRPGDLVFPASSFSARGPEHVQLAAGNGMVIEAPYSGSTVKWSRMSDNAVVVRVL
ncbi:NlpC/P60 family protein [Nocardia sp. NBC_00565]|uniref:C40 family peptidase n=1 Tax=Nocardia sp. NBC_00565 TaxID=2975993 RepID=UPI002E81A629|nr:NlpC/P60 family protein [Nocardia sp. NBC_00565]WUC07673.1 NlpC/P60 family protein [Nocardia sp. NBC_00565]